MRPLRVLVVDDSALNRRTLCELMGQIDGVQIVGVAGDGDEALRMAVSLTPDMITLDLEMPRMDGFTFLRLLMASRPTPVVVVSSHSARENVFRALELGAIDFVAKPEALLSGQINSVRDQLVHMIAIVRQLSPAGMSGRRPASTPPSERPAAGERTPIEMRAVSPPRAREPAALTAAAPAPASTAVSRLLVLGASTGGPTALLDLFSQLPRNSNAAIVVAQHMPERFTRAFAERLDRVSAFSVREAEGAITLCPRQALVCPGGKCIEVEARGQNLVARVVPPHPGDRYSPSADRLFASAAKAAGQRALAVVLTGMGDDGSRGVVEIKKMGGAVLAESEDTAVIFGMPRCAQQTGAVDALLPLPDLIARVAVMLVEPGGAG